MYFIIIQIDILNTYFISIKCLINGSDDISIDVIKRIKKIPDSIIDKCYKEYKKEISIKKYCQNYFMKIV